MRKIPELFLAEEVVVNLGAGEAQIGSYFIHNECNGKDIVLTK
jgi:hypothetical protein